MIILSLVIAVLASAATLLFVLMYVKGHRKYADMIAPLDEKEYPMKDIYGVGYAMLDTFKFDYTGSLSWRLREEATILYSEKYAVYYMRAVLAQALSLGLLALAAGLTFCGLAAPDDQLIMLFVMLGFAGFVAYYFLNRMRETIQKQSDKYMSQFPEVVSKLALLLNSGMILREAWETVSKSENSELYELMRSTMDDIRNGKPEAEAYFKFGLLCGVQDIRKFISMMIQNLSKGNDDLAVILAQQSTELWERRRQQVLQKGELAASKLMMPIGMMFVGILIIVIVPMLANMNMF